MAISVIRRVHSDELARLNRAATRFADRHDLDISARGNPYHAVEILSMFADEVGGTTRLTRLWSRIVCRTLGLPSCVRITVCDGVVGKSC